jgi:pimeloyl-ACP methyl ester carboxylesterase
MHFITAIILELLSITSVIIIKLWKWIYPRPIDEYLIKHNPNINKAIVLVHGSGSNELQFIPARLFLVDLMRDESVSRQVIKSYNIFSLDLTCDKTISEYTLQLSKFISNKVLPNHSEFSLVGYSLGGIIAANYARTFPYVDQLKLVTTVCSPWKGSSLLKTLQPYFPTLQYNRHYEMLPNSDILNELLNYVKDNSRKFYCIGSRNDISVKLSEAIPNNIPNHICDLGHTSTGFSYDLWKKIYTKIILSS